MKNVSIAALVLAISGCATMPTSVSNLTYVDAANYGVSMPDATIVTVKRDQGVLGSGCKIYITVDLKPIASLSTKQAVKFYLPTGSDFILGGGSARSGLCVHNLDEIKISSGGKSQFYRVGFDYGGISISPTAHVD